MSSRLYRRLTARGNGEPFDRHVFACVVAVADGERGRSLADALGLAGDDLVRLFEAYFPHARSELRAARLDVLEADAPEEPDLRALLLEHRACGQVEEAWLAAIIARRSLQPNHLWQDLGLRDRSELGRLLNRHFRSLALLNRSDMKWKKFFYRMLCARDGIFVCKAPSCEMCSDLDVCFGVEDGQPLVALQRGLLESRQKERGVGYAPSSAECGREISGY